MKYAIGIHRAGFERPIVTHSGETDATEQAWAALRELVEAEFTATENDPGVLGVHLLVRPDRVDEDGAVTF